jgi:2-dehydropantoate 2-reductase
VRIVIAGAGAIGGYIGARLARAERDVVLFARGPHLKAMQERGLRVISPDGDFEVKVHATGDLGSIGQADVIFLGVKAHGLTTLAPQLRPLFGPETVVVSTQNGIPWWYFQTYPGELNGLRLERVDPGGVIADAIEPPRVVGSLAYFATDIVEPGVIRHTEGNKISFGEPDGSKSERLRLIAEPLIAAGFRCPITSRLRHEIWVKLLGNIAFNPISALTGGTLEELARHPDVSKVVRQLMAETEAVAARLDIKLPISIDQRMAGAEKVGPHKTSMLQDLEAGRPMELEAIVGAVVELGERLGVPAPATKTVYACAKMLDEKRRGVSSTPPKQLMPIDPKPLAQELMEAYSRRHEIAAPSARYEGFDLKAAYGVEAELARMRRESGHATVGRKVGFANKAMWRVLKLETLVWAHIYDDTVQYARNGEATLSIGHMFAPKIEPEIVFKLKRPIGSDEIDPAAVLDAVEWVALGFEIIDCVFPDWKFQPADFVAAYGLHAALVVGEPRVVEPGMIPALVDALPRFKVKLAKNGELVEEGSGKNSLRSPALCLAELSAGIAKQPDAPPLGAGELVSSGTLTASHPIAAGETWSAQVEGLDVPALTLRLSIADG